ncbi:MAG: hypothetical protein AMJ69_01120 [Gammaproteobacteria bacterium SG8_47]|nr:MAG: hypothetical protein AMJ69_01120 [Gammaproteobacteria bacterium SG8_47]
MAKPPLPAPELDALRRNVQHNCNISDARHAGDYTLCVYLLKMREYFRWEQGLRFSDSLDNAAVGNWLREREALWDALEDRPFEPITIGERRLEPFDSATANELLASENLLYSAGLGVRAKPHFFLAELRQHADYAGHRVLVAGQEYARDLTAPPGMTLDNTIYIRRESLRRMLWEKVEEWRWNRRANAMGRVIEGYDLDADLDLGLERMTERQTETILLHELGELMAGERLGEAWHELLITLPRSKAEFIVRAVRDNLADCLSTLPALLEQQDPNGLHFYFANYSGMQKELFPRLSAAYQHWVDGGALSLISQAVDAGQRHWEQSAHALLELYRRHGELCRTHVEALDDEIRL